jgi:hypothetical protein
MRKLLLLLSLTLGINQMKADSFKVLFVNDATLKYVNGKNVKVGDIFSNVQDIQWEKDKQAVKAINMTTKKQTLFVGKSWIKKTGLDALLHHRHLSTHDELNENTEPTLFDKLAKTFEDQYDLLDSVIVETQVDLSAKRYFQITYEYGDTRLTKKLSHSGKNIIIDTSIFNVDEEKLEPRDVMLTIDYINDDTGETIFVKDVEISFIPNQLDN